QMAVFGYARVSTDGQTLDPQVAELKSAGAERVFKEKVSGAVSERAQLRHVLAGLTKEDILLVTRPDRLARSTRDLLNILTAVARRCRREGRRLSFSSRYLGGHYYAAWGIDARCAWRAS